MGALLENYYAIGHSSADNYIAQVSGQAPDIATQSDCPLWTPFPGAAVAGPYHQVLGEGCVYPAAVPTLGNQLSAAGPQLGRVPAGHGQRPSPGPHGRHGPRTSLRPPRHLGRRPHPERREGDQYAARHDGFTFFASVTANQAFCAAHILSFRPLPGDLARAAATPAFSFIAPDLCNDGHDSPCVTGAPGGLAQADAFLSQWVPAIMAAPAYRDGGLIVITFDEGSDPAACCGETPGISPSHPDVPLPGKTGPGGGRIGADQLFPPLGPAPSAPSPPTTTRCSLDRGLSACRSSATGHAVTRSFGPLGGIEPCTMLIVGRRPG